MVKLQDFLSLKELLGANLSEKSALTSKKYKTEQAMILSKQNCFRTMVYCQNVAY